MTRRQYDAVVVGSGPNGLAAAIEIARAGGSVLVLEAEDTIGGGVRSGELTLPGFVHDLCSAIHPMVLASPFFRSLPLKEHGLELVHPEVPLAHPLADGGAVVLRRSVDETAAGLGADGSAYRALMGPFVVQAEAVFESFMAPLRIPKHPIVAARFTLKGVRSAASVARSAFDGDPARSLFAGMAGHSVQSLEKPLTAGFGIFLGVTAHAVGWPVAGGGSQAIADALVSYLVSLGGTVRSGTRVSSLSDLPSGRVVLFDVTPRQLRRIAGGELPPRYLRALDRYRYGPGVFKVDWALDEPIPWASAEVRGAGTVHLGPTFEDIVTSEKEMAEGHHPRNPYVILAQQSLFDDTRAPPGKHTAWAYCHVPNGSAVDMTDAIESQIERFAPGFREVVAARNVMGPAEVQAHNENLIGGDINGGAQDLRQLFTRPAVRLVPYTTPNKRLFICSSSTPPGGGVHGMCGYFGARAALRRAL